MTRKEFITMVAVCWTCATSVFTLMDAPRILALLGILFITAICSGLIYGAVNN